MDRKQKAANSILTVVVVFINALQQGPGPDEDEWLFLENLKNELLSRITK